MIGRDFMSTVISVNNLKKKYGDITAIDGISFEVEEGSVFAFLGPNGAGKTTTINILCTILEKDSGDVVIDGFSLDNGRSEIRSHIGVVFQDSLLDSLLTVRENLQTRGAFYGLTSSELKKRIADVAQSVNISEILDRPYGKLSGGQKRRADIARAIINSPKILFLDEPTTGLDPQSRLNVWEAVKAMQKETAMTVFLTTHYMEEAASVDDVAIIDRGVIAAHGSPSELKIKYSKDRLKIVPKDIQAFCALMNEKGIIVKAEAGAYITEVENSMQGLELLKEIENYIENFELVRGNMDDVFINVTGRSLREEGGK